MTKAEDRAAAKAWHEERMRQRAEEARSQAIAADLAELGRKPALGMVAGGALGHDAKRLGAA